MGVDTFVLLVETWELAKCKVPDFIRVMNRHGIRVLRYPIIDGSTPADRPSFAALLTDIEELLAAGATIAVSCRGGLGRTGLLAACLLVDGGLDPETAIAVTRASRHNTIETTRQMTFVRAWTSRLPGWLKGRADERARIRGLTRR